MNNNESGKHGSPFLEIKFYSDPMSNIFEKLIIEYINEYIPLDILGSIDQLERAAYAGSSAAQALLGFLYLQGKGVEKDFGLAIMWFSNAIQHPDSNGFAEYGLYSCYSLDLGVTANHGIAMSFLLMSADRGYRPAINAIRKTADKDYIEWLTTLVLNGVDGAKELLSGILKYTK
jgi:TPR repeat protein